MFPFFLWVGFGAFVGWLASLVVGTPDRHAWTVGNVVVGAVGSGVGGFLFQRAIRPDVVSVGSVLTALSGAIILLAIANLFVMGRVR